MNKWRIEIAELSSSSVLNQISVEASNWINALRLGRQSLGDAAEVPQGASCTILPSGIVTILDPTSRRKFTLTKENEIAPQKVISVAPPPISEPIRKSDPPIISTRLNRKSDPPIISTRLNRKSDPPKAKSAAVRKSQPPSATSDSARKRDSVKPAKTKRVSNRPLAGTRDSVIESLRKAAFSKKEDKPKQKHEQEVAPAKPNTAAQKPDVVGQEPPKRKPVMQKTVSYVLDPELRKQIKSVAVGNKGKAKKQPQPEPNTTSEPQHVAAVQMHSDRGEQPIESLPSTTAPNQGTQTASDSTEQTHTTAKNLGKPLTAESKTSTSNRYGFELLIERNEEPNHENPLTYRERCFVIPKGISLPEIEAAMHEQIAILQDELKEAPKGIFVNLAAFDHRWSVQPDRPPIAIMQWKDWRGDPQIEFPVNNKPTTSQSPASADRSNTLENAFEALHELQFLNTAAEGLDFVMKFLREAVPTEASSACLYDINTHELRFVVVYGPAADQRKGEAVPLTSGLFGHAAKNYDSPTIVTDVSTNSFFDPEIDSRPDLVASNILYRPLALNEQLLGMIQLINRTHQTEFSEQDVNLIDYIAVQLSQFVHSSRMKPEEKQE